MDLTLEVEDYTLNIRAAGMIIHNNRILLHKNINKDHYALPGGRVMLGENSVETVKRELEEELGKNILILNHVATIENFFELDSKKYHEIFFLHKAEFSNEEDKKIDYTLYNIEGKEYLQYQWIDIDKIEYYNLVPKCVKDILKMKQFPVHMINNELEKLKK